MESHRWQAGSFEEPMEPMRDVRSVRERAESTWENQVEVDPSGTGSEPLQGLTPAVRAQRTDHDWRQDERPPASRCLRLDQLGAAMRDPLCSSANAKYPGVQVDVAPLKTKSL